MTQPWVGREAPKGLEYVAMIFAAALDFLHVRDILTVAAMVVLMTAIADEAIRGPLSQAPALDETASDPILAEVGETSLRVSDVRAQAVLADAEEMVAEMSPAALVHVGFLEVAAEQEALARAAEMQGLDQALEIQAELALARRRILSSAYLDQAVRQAVTDEAVRAEYDRRLAEADDAMVLSLRRILVSSEDEAVTIKRRIEGGLRFADMARRQSLDVETSRDGGQVGNVTMSELPPSLMAAVRGLPLGNVSDPIPLDRGWYLVVVESRRAVRLPPFADLAEDIEADLRHEAVAETVAETVSMVPIRVARTEAIFGDLVAGSAATVSFAAW